MKRRQYHILITHQFVLAQETEIVPYTHYPLVRPSSRNGDSTIYSLPISSSQLKKRRQYHILITHQFVLAQETEIVPYTHYPLVRPSSRNGDSTIYSLPISSSQLKKRRQYHTLITHQFVLAQETEIVPYTHYPLVRPCSRNGDSTIYSLPISSSQLKKRRQYHTLITHQFVLAQETEIVPYTHYPLVRPSSRNGDSTIYSLPISSSLLKKRRQYHILITHQYVLAQETEIVPYTHYPLVRPCSRNGDSTIYSLPISSSQLKKRRQYHTLITHQFVLAQETEIVPYTHYPLVRPCSRNGDSTIYSLPISSSQLKKRRQYHILITHQFVLAQETEIVPYTHYPLVRPSSRNGDSTIYSLPISSSLLKKRRQYHILITHQFVLAQETEIVPYTHYPLVRPSSRNGDSTIHSLPISSSQLKKRRQYHILITHQFVLAQETEIVPYTHYPLVRPSSRNGDSTIHSLPISSSQLKKRRQYHILITHQFVLAQETEIVPNTHYPLVRPSSRNGDSTIYSLPISSSLLKKRRQYHILITHQFVLAQETEIVPYTHYPLVRPSSRNGDSTIHSLPISSSQLKKRRQYHILITHQFVLAQETEIVPYTHYPLVRPSSRNGDSTIHSLPISSSQLKKRRQYHILITHQFVLAQETEIVPYTHYPLVRPSSRNGDSTIYSLPISSSLLKKRRQYHILITHQFVLAQETEIVPYTHYPLVRPSSRNGDSTIYSLPISSSQLKKRRQYHTLITHQFVLAQETEIVPYTHYPLVRPCSRNGDSTIYSLPISSSQLKKRRQYHTLITHQFVLAQETEIVPYTHYPLVRHCSRNGDSTIYSLPISSSLLKNIYNGGKMVSDITNYAAI